MGIAVALRKSYAAVSNFFLIYSRTIGKLELREVHKLVAANKQGNIACSMDKTIAGLP
jgi:hypothetical protein